MGRPLVGGRGDGTEFAKRLNDLARSHIRSGAAIYCDGRRDHCSRPAEAHAAFE
jgi:hypothetical protein